MGNVKGSGGLLPNLPSIFDDSFATPNGVEGVGKGWVHLQAEWACVSNIPRYRKECGQALFGLDSVCQGKMEIPFPVIVVQVNVSQPVTGEG